MKNFLIRIIFYPICLIMIYGGVYMIGNYQNWSFSFIRSKQFFSGIGLIIIALLFVISDLLIIIRKSKKEN